MSFETLGFFSPDLERFRESVRASPECRDWFDLASQLVRLGFDVLNDIDVSADDRARLTAAIIFSQAHESFQAGIILAERGMVSDARTVARSAVESAIALFALSKDEDFVDLLIGSHHRHSLVITRLVIETPEARAHLTAQQLQELQERLSELQALPPERRAAINWADVGRKYCPGVYDTMYRVLSNDGPHVSMTVISRRVEIHEGRISKIKVGPDIEKLTETLNASCGAFLHSLTAVLHLFPDELRQERLKRLSDLFGQTPTSDPSW